MENATSFINNTNVSFNNSPPTPHLSPIEVLLRFEPASVYIDRIVSPIWYGIGLIGNPISAKVWLGKRSRKNSSAIYLGILALVHTLNLIMHFSLNELTYTWRVPTNNNHVLCQALSVVAMIPQYLSPLLVLSFTIERYIAVCHPFKKETFCTVRRALIVTTALAVLACTLALVQAWLWKYYPKFNVCLNNDNLHNFNSIWTAASEIMFFLVVPLCVLFFNILVIREIKRITSHGPAVTSSSGNQTSTITLLAVSFYFICTLIPTSIVYAIQNEVPQGNPDIVNSFELMASDPIWLKYFKFMAVRKVVEEICLSNSACYIFIYYITGTFFRQEVNKIICFWKKHDSMDSTMSNEKTKYSLVATNQNGYGNYGKPATQI